MDRFIISGDPCSFGFAEHVNLDPRKNTSEQLNRRFLHVRSGRVGRAQGDAHALRKIIDKNASLRIDFGWSFESAYHYNTIMKEAVETITPKYNIGVSHMVSDMRCSWLGFIPYNVFERTVYEDLNVYGLIQFNNELVAFQNEIVEFISTHKIFLQHSILRNDRYRFAFFKEVRKDPEKLASAFHDYMEAVKEVSLINSLPRFILEEQIGCHFLHQPDLFFELLEFSILKGDICE